MGDRHPTLAEIAFNDSMDQRRKQDSLNERVERLERELEALRKLVGGLYVEGEVG